MLPPVFDSNKGDTYTVSLVDKVPYLSLDEESLEVKVDLNEFHKLNPGLYTFKIEIKDNKQDKTFYDLQLQNIKPPQITFFPFRNET
jgi:hypothetical protein